MPELQTAHKRWQVELNLKVSSDTAAKAQLWVYQIKSSWFLIKQTKRLDFQGTCG